MEKMSNQVPKNIAPQDLNIWLKQDSDKPILVDVREDYELAIARFPFPFIHLPLSNVSFWHETYQEQLSLKKSIVVICHAGIRSFDFSCWLLSENRDYDVWNLEGGIDAWSVMVDKDIPRY